MKIKIGNASGALFVFSVKRQPRFRFSVQLERNKFIAPSAAQIEARASHFYFRFRDISPRAIIVYSLKNNCYLLSGVGLRAVIEAVCIEQSITGRNLEVKINNLVKNKLITEKDANRLHSIRFLGNDSVHEMDVPNEAKLRAAIEIVEHMLKNLYLIDIEASEHLDTIISNYDDFKALFLRKYRNTREKDN